MRPIGLVGVEPVIVRLELLPDEVALALDALGIGAGQADKVIHPATDRAHEGIVRVEIAGVGGAEAAAVRFLEQLAGLCDGVDHRAQPLAFGLVEEIADREQLRILDRKGVDAGVRRQPRAHLAPDVGERFPVGVGGEGGHGGGFTVGEQSGQPLAFPSPRT